MALDFHLASTEEEAPYKNASASFEMQTHELIFYRFGLPEGRFTLFKRMDDYYKDAKYNIQEVQALISEIKVVKQKFISNKQISEQLNSILAVCESAVESNLSIWVYCD